MSDDESAASRAAYDVWHASRDIDAEADTPWARIIRSNLQLEEMKRKRILEIGCGRGDFSCWLARQLNGEASQVAADFSPAAVEKGRSFAESHGLAIDWQIMDIQQIAAPQHS